jgi:2,5-furandicarboxylate decarboxylase 1
LNPSFPNYLGSKLGFDATRPFPRKPEYDRAAYKKADTSHHQIAIKPITTDPT